MTVLRLGDEWTTRLDCIDLVLRNTTGVPVRSTTWGRLKTLYAPPSAG